MGLDGVELVLATEEEFKIAIDDADAPNITTPRMLADYVVSRLNNVGETDNHCLSQSGFYKIRSVLTKQFGALRKDIHPDSPVQQFLKGDLRTQWNQLRTATNANQLPNLKCKKHIYYLITIGIPLPSTLLLLKVGFPIWVALLALFALWVIANVITEQMGDLIPPEFSTIRTLIPYVGIDDPHEWSHEYVLQRVIQITSRQLGIPIEKIHPDHHFVKDLGLN